MYLWLIYNSILCTQTYAKEVSLHMHHPATHLSTFYQQQVSWVNNFMLAFGKI